MGVKTALEFQEFYSHNILNFIREEEFARQSLLVRVLASGERRPPTKKLLKEHFSFSKDLVTRFSEQHPDVLDRYKRFYAEIEGALGPPRLQDFDDEFDEVVFARALAAALPAIAPGSAVVDL